MPQSTSTKADGSDLEQELRDAIALIEARGLQVVPAATTGDDPSSLQRPAPSPTPLRLMPSQPSMQTGTPVTSTSQPSMTLPQPLPSHSSYFSVPVIPQRRTFDASSIGPGPGPGPASHSDSALSNGSASPPPKRQATGLGPVPISLLKKLSRFQARSQAQPQRRPVESPRRQASTTRGLEEEPTPATIPSNRMIDQPETELMDEDSPSPGNGNTSN